MSASSGRYLLDIKFVEGMRHACELWPGQIDCLLREGISQIPFGAEFEPTELPFGLQVLPAAAAVPAEKLDDYDIVEASGDLTLDFQLAAPATRKRCKIVFVIEYTLQTRLQILSLEQAMNPVKKAKSAGWHVFQELRRRRAFKAADGIQANGYPAYEQYQGLNANTLLYLDNRMRADLFATTDELDSRAQHLDAGGPLRLIHSGRLEAMKGTQDLVPLARALRKKDVSFLLDIYGTGSLEGELRTAISESGLQDCVRLHAPVDFESELVPISRSTADIFLSCHRQSDPSCTYLEAMGCGLPVVGYANSMLTRLVEASMAGWAVGLGDIEALADKIALLSKSPEAVRTASVAALSFGRSHGFEAEFARRNTHLLQVVEEG